MLLAAPIKTLAGEETLPPLTWPSLPEFQNFSGEPGALHKIGKIWLPYNQKFLLSGSIHKVRARKSYFLPILPASLEFNKRASLTDFGVIGMINWPIISKENWSFDFKGRISGAQHYFGPAYQRTRWNFEHQLGWDVNYRLTDSVRTAVGLYHYRIINDFQSDNPAQSYINSNGGFASLIMKF